MCPVQEQWETTLLLVLVANDSPWNDMQIKPDEAFLIFRIRLMWAYLLNGSVDKDLLHLY